MSSFSNVSLILMSDQGQSAPEISRTVHALATRRWDAQVLLVDNSFDQPETEVQSTDCSPHQKLANLSEAISAARHSVIAIVDGDFEVTPGQWQLVADRLERAPVQAIYRAPITSRATKRFLVWLYALMLRFFYRTRRNELQCGLTVLQQSVLKNGLPPTIGQRDREPGGFQVTRMLALLRLQRVPILETEINDPHVTKPIPQPRTRTIRRAGSRAIRFWWNTIMFPRAENQMEHKTTKPIQKLGLTVLLLATALYLFFSSLNYPLIKPDEARNAQLAINLIESGQWMSLSLTDENYWDKPPLQIWAIAASYKLMGVSPFATRFPVALVAMLTVLSTLVIGKRLVGFRSAWLGSGLLLLTSGFVFSGRFVTMDASLTAMVTICLLFGYIAIRDNFRKRLAILAGIACGFGLLIKGPIIVVLCAPPLLVSAWLSKTGQSRTRRNWLWFAFPALLIAAPWFIATSIIHPEFLSYFFWKHHVIRFSAAFNHRGPFWFYFLGIFLFMFPASYLLPSVTKFMTSRRPENRLLRTREQGFLFLSVLWILFFFTLSESKLPAYIVPAFPPICLLMGVLLERKILNKFFLASQLDSESERIRPTIAQQHKRTYLEGLTRRAPFELAFGIVALSGAVYVLDPSHFASFLAMGLPAVILILLVVLVIRFRTTQKIAWACFGLMALFTVLLATHHLMPTISRTRSVYRAAEKLAATPEFKDAPVVFFGRETYGVGLTLDLERVIYFEATQNYSLIKFLEQNPTAIIVSSKEPMESLRDDLPWTIALEECEQDRHLFLSRPNSKILARERAQNLYR